MNHENIPKALALIVGSYLVGVIFTLVEWDFAKQYSFFPFFHGHSGWDGKMALGTYVYYICEHASAMMIFYACYLVCGWRILNVLFWVEFADLIDYLLCYHEAWFKIRGFEFEFNYIKIATVCIFSAIELTRSDRS